MFKIRLRQKKLWKLRKCSKTVSSFQYSRRKIVPMERGVLIFLDYTVIENVEVHSVGLCLFLANLVREILCSYDLHNREGKRWVERIFLWLNLFTQIFENFWPVLLWGASIWVWLFDENVNCLTHTCFGFDSMKLFPRICTGTYSLLLTESTNPTKLKEPNKVRLYPYVKSKCGYLKMFHSMFLEVLTFWAKRKI